MQRHGELPSFCCGASDPCDTHKPATRVILDDPKPTSWDKLEIDKALLRYIAPLCVSDIGSKGLTDTILILNHTCEFGEKCFVNYQVKEHGEYAKMSLRAFIYLYHKYLAVPHRDIYMEESDIKIYQKYPNLFDGQSGIIMDNMVRFTEFEKLERHEALYLVDPISVPQNGWLGSLNVFFASTFNSFHGPKPSH